MEYLKNSKYRALINLLSSGGKFSAITIANILTLGDPRSYIRNLRKFGVPVSDEWKATRDGKGRYKLYFITPKTPQV